MRHLIDILDLSVAEIDELVSVAMDIIDNRPKYADVCKGRILATLFFEPSTRTRLSFESAMLSLGGSVLGFSSAANSSTSKGETVADTTRMASSYVDVIAMRHPKEGAPKVASMVSSVPVINAGDGGHYHPTQTLTDILTIRREMGRIDNLTIGLCGDLKFGRTVHSLIHAMSRYEGIKFVMISPEELKVPEYMKRDLLATGRVEWVENDNLEDAIGELDVLYMTRVQQERFASEEEYLRLRDSYILTPEVMAKAKPDMRVLHPLPRVNEISFDVDDDPRAAYFRQAQNGRFIRMALIMKVLGLTPMGAGETAKDEAVELPVRCEHGPCISVAEKGIKPLFHKVEGEYRCLYCDSVAPKF